MLKEYLNILNAQKIIIWHIIIKSKNLKVIRYSDVNFYSDTNDDRYTSGNIFLLVGGIVSWCNKKQIHVAKITMEAEYNGCSNAAFNAV